MPEDLYSKAHSKFEKAEFASAVNTVDELLKDIHLNSDLKTKVLILKAQSLTELKHASAAREIYQELKLYTHAGFCAILEGDLDLASKLYEKAMLSPALKWGKFLVSLLTDPGQTIESPGYLTFRLYFEASFGYLLLYDLQDYIGKIKKHKLALTKIYPETIKDIGSAYLSFKDYKEALSLFDEAIAKFTNDTGSYFKSAMAYLGLKDNENAKKFLEKVDNMLPGSSLINRLISEL